MSFQTVEENGTPWMVCDAPDAAEPLEVARKSGLDMAAVVVRPATQREAAKLRARKLLEEMAGGDPDKIFGELL